MKLDCELFPNYLIIFLAIIAIIMASAIFAFCTPIEGDNYLKNKLTNHEDFTYAPHYVKFHIIPEQENLGIAAWASDDLPPTTGYTDNNSDLTLELISTVEYNLWIPERKVSVYIYPSENEYEINTDRRSK